MQVGGRSTDSSGRNSRWVQVDGRGIRRWRAIDRRCRCDHDGTSWMLARVKAALVSERHAAE